MKYIFFLIPEIQYISYTVNISQRIHNLKETINNKCNPHYNSSLSKKLREVGDFTYQILNLNEYQYPGFDPEIELESLKRFYHKQQLNSV